MYTDVCLCVCWQAGESGGYVRYVYRHVSVCWQAGESGVYVRYVYRHVSVCWQAGESGGYVRYVCVCWYVMQQSSLASLMDDLQTVYGDDTADDDMYTLQVPRIGQCHSLFVVEIPREQFPHYFLAADVTRKLSECYEEVVCVRRVTKMLATFRLSRHVEKCRDGLACR